MKSISSTRFITRTGIVAAAYAAFTVAIAPLSYGPVQFRFSELLLILIYFDRRYAPGLVLGCALANMYSPLGMVDVVVGTTATVLALIGMIHTPNKAAATLWPALTNGIIVGLELYILEGYPLWMGISTVAFGEFVVVTCIGYPVYRVLIGREKLAEAIRIS